MSASRTKRLGALLPSGAGRAGWAEPIPGGSFRGRVPALFFDGPEAPRVLFSPDGEIAVDRLRSDDDAALFSERSEVLRWRHGIAGSADIDGNFDPAAMAAEWRRIRSSPQPADRRALKAAASACVLGFSTGSGILPPCVVRCARPDGLGAGLISAHRNFPDEAERDARVAAVDDFLVRMGMSGRIGGWILETRAGCRFVSCALRFFPVALPPLSSHERLDALSRLSAWSAANGAEDAFERFQTSVGSKPVSAASA